MKKPIVVALFLWLLLLSPAAAWAEPVKPGQLKVATYNIENLFDVFDDPYTPDERTRVKPREQLEQVAAMIRKLDADIIAFQEIENEHVLKAFITEMLGDMNYKYVACGSTNDGRGIRNAIASRLPIRSITSHRFIDLKLEDDPRLWRFARDLMQVQIELSDQRVLHTFIVHFKSKRDDGADKQGASWRLAEATAVKRIIDGLLKADPQAWIIMTGDLNDTPESAPVQKLLAPADTEGGSRLTDLHAHLTGEEAVSYLKKPHRDRIDYIMTSPALTRRLVKESAVIVNSDTDLTAGADHAPVVATFEIKD